MENPKLIEYIHDLLAKGYTMSKIKDFCNNYYNSDEVEFAISSLIERYLVKLKPYAENMYLQGTALFDIKKQFLQKEYDKLIVEKLIEEIKEDIDSGKLLKQDTISKSTSDNSILMNTNKHNNSANLNHSTNNDQDDEIEAYIKAMLKSGYSLESIQSMLLNQGFDTQKVHNIIIKIHQHHFYFSKTAVFGFIILIIVTMAASSLYFSLFDNPFSAKQIEKRLLDVKVIETDSKIVELGKAFEFNINAINLGDRDEYDVMFKYLITDQAGQEIISSSETKAISTSLDFDYEVLIDKDNFKHGKYKVLVEADYIDGIAKSGFTFSVKDPNINDGSDKDYTSSSVKPLDPTIIKEPEEILIETTPDEREIFVSKNDGKFELIIREVESKEYINLETIVLSNYDVAVDYCNSLAIDGSKQKCLQTVSLYEDKLSCENLVSYMGYTKCMDDESEIKDSDSFCSQFENYDNYLACVEVFDSSNTSEEVDSFETTEDEIEEINYDFYGDEIITE